MRRWGLAGLALALLLCGVRADEKKPDKEAAVKQEWKRLNGTWEWVRAAADGKEAPAPKSEKLTLTLRDGKYTLRRWGEVEEEGTAKIDPTASPKSLDLVPRIKPPLDAGKTVLAVYEVKGDTCRIGMAGPGTPRPKALEPKKGSEHSLGIFKRVKS
jgi:uncharacterized protein (TIGR03067 family)